MGVVEKIIEKIVVDAAVDGAMKAMEKEGRKPGERLAGGALVLRFGVIIKTLVYGYMVFSMFIGVIGLFIIEGSIDLYIYIGLMIFLFILNLLLFMTVRNVRIEIDNVNVIRYGAFGKIKKVWWNEIRKVKIIPRNKTVIIFGDKVKIRITSNFVGYSDFLAYVNRKVDQSAIHVIGRES